MVVAERRRAPTVEEYAGYSEERMALAAAFKAIGRGAQQRAAFDCRLTPTAVSWIIRGLSIDTEGLGRLKEWAAAQQASAS